MIQHLSCIICDIRSPKYTPVLAAVMLLVQRELALLEDN